MRNQLYGDVKKYLIANIDRESGRSIWATGKLRDYRNSLRGPLMRQLPLTF